MASSRATVNKTKLVELHQESLQITYICPYHKSPLVSNEDDIIKCSCGIIPFVDTITPYTNVKVTILDENKRRIDLQVKLEQLDACYDTTDDSAKQERACKMLKTKVNAPYDTDTMLVITSEVVKKKD